MVAVIVLRAAVNPARPVSRRSLADGADGLRPAGRAGQRRANEVFQSLLAGVGGHIGFTPYGSRALGERFQLAKPFREMVALRPQSSQPYPSGYYWP